MSRHLQAVTGRARLFCLLPFPTLSVRLSFSSGSLYMFPCHLSPASLLSCSVVAYFSLGKEVHHNSLGYTIIIPTQGDLLTVTDKKYKIKNTTYIQVDGAMIKLWAIQGVAASWCWSALMDCSLSPFHPSSHGEAWTSLQSVMLNTKYKHKWTLPFYYFIHPSSLCQKWW